MAAPPMLSGEEFRAKALELPDVQEEPYRHGTSFRVRGRVLATLWADRMEANIKASPELQGELIETHPEAFFQIPNSWGKKGWTGIRLAHVRATELAYALEHCRETF